METWCNPRVDPRGCPRRLEGAGAGSTHWLGAAGFAAGDCGSSGRPASTGRCIVGCEPPASCTARSEASMSSLELQPQRATAAKATIHPRMFIPPIARRAGSCVETTLPATGVPQSLISHFPETASRQELCASSALTILAAGDNPTNQLILRPLLKPLGVPLTLATARRP